MIELKTKTANPDFHGVFDVSAQEVNDLQTDLLLVDVRAPEELAGELGHISGIQHIVLDQIRARLSELPQDRTIVFVCRSGARSAMAASFAAGQGYHNVYNMRGGMLAWNSMDFTTAK